MGSCANAEADSAVRGYFCPLTNFLLVSNSYYGTSSRSSARAKARALAAPEREIRWRRGVVYFLPAILVVLTALVTGCYFENADDMTIILLLQGDITAQPASVLHVGFFGIGHVLRALYSLTPDVPWYGLVMYAILYLSLVLHTSVVQRLGRRLLSNSQIAVVVTALFLLAWTEHIMWFNFTRISVLLASGAFLAYCFDDKESGSRHIRAAVLYTLAFALALCIFPTAAVLGMLLALPAAIRVPARSGLDFKNLVSTLVPFLVVSVVFFSATVLSRSEEEVGLNRLLGHYNDYLHNGYYFFRPVGQLDAPDAARTNAVREALRSGMLSDRLALNESFFARAGEVDFGQFIRVRLGEKLAELFKRVGRDYFLALLLNVIVVVYCFLKLRSSTRRTLLLGTQFWILLILLVVGGLWKLPPRLVGPSMVVLTMVNLVFFLRHRRFSLPKMAWWAWVMLVGLFSLQIYRTGSRTLTLAAKQTLNEQYVASLERRFSGKLLVGVSLETYFPALSPWQHYSFGQNKLLLLTGWQTLAPEFRDYLSSLTGQTQFLPAVQALVARPKTVWITPIGFEQRLNRLLLAVHHTEVVLLPFKPYVPGPALDEFNQYLVALPPGRQQPFGPLPGKLLPVAAGSQPDTITTVTFPATSR